MKRSLPLDLLVLLSGPLVAGIASAQYIPPFSQTFTHPNSRTTTSALHYNTATLDTSITFQPLEPPDNDWGIAPITSSMDFSGSVLHWALSLDLAPNGTLLRTHDYTPTNSCNAVFRLYGLALGDTAVVTVRAISKLDFVRSGPHSLGLSRARVSLTTNRGTAAHEATHFHGDPLFMAQDTLDVPVRVLGNDQFLTFQLTALAHVEMIDGGSPRVDVTADVSFLDVPAGMTVVNAYGYGNVVLGVPGDESRAGVLRARPRGDGRQVMLAGVGPGAAEVDLFDLSGRRLAGAQVAADAASAAAIPLPSPLRSGIYFVRCRDVRGVRTTRFAFAR